MFGSFCFSVCYNIQKSIKELVIGQSNEEDIIYVMGFEPTSRDFTSHEVVLMYNYVSKQKVQIMCFILKKNHQNKFVLSKIYTPKNIKKKLSLKNPNFKILKQEIFKYLQQSTISLDQLEDKKEYKTKQDNHSIFTNFGFNYITNYQKKDIDILNKYIMKLNKSPKHINKLIFLFFAILMIINNPEQIKGFQHSILMQFYEKYSSQDLSPKSIYVMYGVPFFINQQIKSLKNQIGLNFYSKFFLLNKYLNSYSKKTVSYEITQNNTTQKFNNIYLHMLDYDIYNAYCNLKVLNEKIFLNDNCYVVFTNEENYYDIDIIYEIAMVNIPQQYNDHVRSICYSKDINKNILIDLKKIPGVDINMRYISKNNTSEEDINILNAVEYSQGKYIGENNNKIIVLLQINSYRKNHKHKKQAINQETIELLIKLLFNKLYPLKSR